MSESRTSSSRKAARPVLPNTEALLERGRLGRFNLESVLGIGAMGAVLRAEDRLLHRHVAVKLLPVIEDSRHQGRFLDRFLREARFAARLVHPHVMQIYKVGTAEGHAYIEMELVDGPTFKQLIERAGPLAYPRACELVAQAAEALDYAHEVGVLHRDVKPDNLLLRYRGGAKLCDFGFASADPRRTASNHPDHAGHETGQSQAHKHLADESTRAGRDYSPRQRVFGTPRYMAPEAARGEPIPTSDLWSLACVLWFLLTGDSPFDVHNAYEARRVIIEIPRADLRRTRPDLPEGLVAFFDRALSLEVDQRIPSGQAFADALKPFVLAGQGLPVARSANLTQPAATAITDPEDPTDTGQPTASSHVSPSHPSPPKPRPKRPWLPWLIGLLTALAAFAIAAAMTWGWPVPMSIL